MFDTEGKRFRFGDLGRRGPARTGIRTAGVFHRDRPACNGRTQYQEFLNAFESDRRLQTLEAKREKQFYEEQSEILAMFIRILGIAITVIFSIGADHRGHDHHVRGGLQQDRGDRYAPLPRVPASQRPGRIPGGILPALHVRWDCRPLLASVLQFFSVSMINFMPHSPRSRSAFRFLRILSFLSLLFSLIMGLVGGFLPAVRASRLDILTAPQGGVNGGQGWRALGRSWRNALLTGRTLSA